MWVVFGGPRPQKGEWEVSVNLCEKADGPKCWFEELPPVGVLKNFCQVFGVALSWINYGGKLISMKILPLLEQPGALQTQAAVVQPARPEERWEMADLAPKKGKIHWEWPFSLQIFHICALLRCCYLTTGIRMCSPAGFAALAHWQVRAISAAPTRPWLWKGHACPGKACPLHFKNSRNQILSVTVTNRATGDTA